MLDEPQAPEHLAPVWAAFQALTTSRQIGFGAVGPLAYRDMLLYLDENGIGDKDERDEMLYLLREMDAEYLHQVNTRDGKEG